jgi:hypothetical protein
MVPMRMLAVVVVMSIASVTGCKKSEPPAPPPNTTQAALAAGGTLNSDGSVTNANGTITEPNGTVVPASNAGGNTAGTAAGAPSAAATDASSASTPAPPAAPTPPPPPVTLTAPRGTVVTIRTTEELSSSRDGVGTRFSGVLEHPVVSHGNVVFERGTPVAGEVVASKNKGEFKGAGDLAIVLTAIGKHPVKTTEYVQVDKGRGKRTGAFIGGGGGLGAVIGGLAGGGKGALIGGLAGAGAGTAASTTGSKNVIIRPESLITFRLTEPVTR